MIAKVPPRRSDGKSSFAKLVEYATKREDEKKVLTDELDPSYSRRDNTILEAARAHLERAADHLRASGRISSLDADAIRKRLGSARRALDPNGRRLVADTYGLPNHTDEPRSRDAEGVTSDENEEVLPLLESILQQQQVISDKLLELTLTLRHEPEPVEPQLRFMLQPLTEELQQMSETLLPTSN